MGLGIDVSLIELEQLKALPVFPLADAYPMLNSDDAADLATDIAKRGEIIQAIIIFNDQLLDGRNRLKGIELANKSLDEGEQLLQIPVRYFEGSDEDAEDLVIGLNEKRRDLTVGQKAVIADKHREIIEARSKTRQLSGLKQFSTVQENLPERENGLQTRDILAGKHHVNSRYIDDIKRLRRTSQETMIDQDTGDQMPTPRAQKALTGLRSIESGKETVNAIVQKVFKEVPMNPNHDDPIGRSRNKLLTATSNIKKEITNLADISKKGEAEYNFIGTKISEIISHFENEFGVKVDCN